MSEPTSKKLPDSSALSDGSGVRKRKKSAASKPEEPVLETTALEDTRLYGNLPPARVVGANRRSRPTAAGESTGGGERGEDGRLAGGWRLWATAATYAASWTCVLEFPLFCFRHGGVTFFVPYAVLLLAVGAPLLLVEWGGGQFASRPAASAFAALNPSFSGVGRVILLVGFWRLLSAGALVIRAAHLFLLAVEPIFSRRPVAWSGCNEAASSRTCVDYNYTLAMLPPAALEENARRPEARLTPPFLDFLQTQIFPSAFRVDQLQAAPWGVWTTAAVCWAALGCLAAIGTRRATGGMIAVKLVGFLLLLACALFAIFSPVSSTDGFWFFLSFDHRHLYDGSAWADATRHVLTSLSLMDGTVHKLGALHRFRSSFAPALLVVLVASFVLSCVGAVVFFASLSAVTGVLFPRSVDDRVERMVEFVGHGRLVSLAVFPDLVGAAGVSPLLAAAFFLALVTLALSQAVIGMAKLAQAAEGSRLLGGRLRQSLAALAVCGATAPLVLLVVQPWAPLVVRLWDHALDYVVFAVALAEVLIFAYAYDARRFIVDVRTMHGGRLPHWATGGAWVWLVFVCPFALAIGILFAAAFCPPIRFGAYVADEWLGAVGWAPMTLAVGLIPLGFVVHVVRWFRRRHAPRVLFAARPSWRPARPADWWAARRARRTFGVEANYLRTKFFDPHDPLNFRHLKRDDSEDEPEVEQKQVDGANKEK